METGQLRKNAIRILLGIFGAAIILHILVVVGIVPPAAVWGGRIENRFQFYVLEAVSLILNSTFILLCLIAANLIKIRLSEKVLRRCFYVMGIVFFLNTIGNIFSLNDFEKTFFTGVTLAVSILSFLVAIK